MTETEAAPPRIDLSDEALGRVVEVFLSGVLLSR